MEGSLKGANEWEGS